MDALDQGLAAQLLAQHGIAPTPQRVAVACVMLDRRQHLSAEQVLDRLKRRGARVSKATVYNTLRLFAARGLLRELTVDRDRAFFDSNLAPHYHFYNVDDGTLTDFDADTLRISDVPALPEGTAHAGIDVIVRVCHKPRAPWPHGAPAPPRLYQRRPPYTLRTRAGVAQSVEQLIRNQQVGGSIPLAGTKEINKIRLN